MKINEILQEIREHPYLKVYETTPLNQVARELIEHPEIRSIYVVDAQERLKGTLSLGTLIRSLTAERHRPYFHTRSLLECITCQQVGDIMNEDVLSASAQDDVERVLNLMINRNIKEIPIVDQKGRLVSNVGLLDIWRLTEADIGSSKGCKGKEGPPGS